MKKVFVIVGGNHNCVLDVDYQGRDRVLYRHLRQMILSNTVLGHYPPAASH